MREYSRQLIEKTKLIWQDESEYEISDNEAVEIIENTNSFFEIIIELENKYGQKKANI